ncbi:hypothetical protein D6810_01010 [Candidatus Dojkabacteria bacterium]|uniref:F0F1 ATP synthase subunit gamma n=1 Tax=Candidatus Dojkabacteria bacterium TaxID=2099670 RepID=A0A3M0Z1S4_9BACT|nr:MAG: hypothetical protein D6810_01010 [Candidatus Dojkabacteria bacterium]
MASLKQIKQRIKSVKDTKKVTKTMELISTVNFQKANNLINHVKEYSDELNKIRLSLGLDVDSLVRETFESQSRRKLLVIVSSDRGFSGSFLPKIKKFIQLYIKEKGLADEVILLGKKLVSYLAKLSMTADEVIYFSSFKNYFNLAEEVFKLIRSKLEQKQIGSASVIYTKFESLSNQYVDEMVLFTDSSAGQREKTNSYIDNAIVEPDRKEVSEYLVNAVLKCNIYLAVVQSVASEHLSRMFAMKKATNAAQDMIAILQNLYNKTRQDLITKEIIEVISGMKHSLLSINSSSKGEKDDVLYKLKLFFNC